MNGPICMRFVLSCVAGFPYRLSQMCQKAQNSCRNVTFAGLDFVFIQKHANYCARFLECPVESSQFIPDLFCEC